MSTTLPTEYESHGSQSPLLSLMEGNSTSIELKVEDPRNILTTNNLLRVFNQLDYTKSGTLNLSEFSSLCYIVNNNNNNNNKKNELNDIDIHSIFNIIDGDDNKKIDFNEFSTFINPKTNNCNNNDINDIGEAFVSKLNSNKTVNKHNHNHRSFDDVYITTFYSRDMGIELISGINNINCYIKYRFTLYSLKNVCNGSKIIEINNKLCDGLTYNEILNFLYMIIITKNGFQVKFKPPNLLKNDKYYPLNEILNDDIADDKLLQPMFDKKKGKSRALKKKLKRLSQLNLHPDDNGEYSMNTFTTMDVTSTTAVGVSGDDILGNNSIYNEDEYLNIMIPLCWFKCPNIITRMLCINKISSIKELKRYNTHCRHCPALSRKYKLKFHLILNDEKYSKLSWFIQVFVMMIILISTISYVLETLPIISSNESAMIVFKYIEYVVSIIFTFEYLCRIIVSRNLCIFFWDSLNFIDFIAILPFWIEIISGSGEGSTALRVIRVIRLARVFRLMKSPRFAEYMNILQETILKSMPSFGLFLILIFLEIIIASSLVYVCESNQVNTQFTSIPATSWWAFVTVTTIGYGDMVPSSIAGRIICVFTLFSGLLVIALPVIIIGGNFEKEYKKYLKRKNKWTVNYDFDKNRKNEIFTIARLLHFINENEKKDIFDWEDVRYLYNDGLISFEIINKILMLTHGYIYLPDSFSAYKKYSLFQFYGKKLRNNIKKIKGIKKIKQKKNNNKLKNGYLSSSSSSSESSSTSSSTTFSTSKWSENDEKEEEYNDNNMDPNDNDIINDNNNIDNIVIYDGKTNGIDPESSVNESVK